MLEIYNQDIRAHEQHPQWEDQCDPCKFGDDQQQYQTEREANQRYPAARIAVRRPIVDVTNMKMAAIFVPNVFMRANAMPRPTA